MVCIRSSRIERILEVNKEQELMVNTYVQKYANKHHITVEEARKHALVSYYAEHVVNTIRGGSDGSKT